jgi:hypothetical protein
VEVEWTEAFKELKGAGGGGGTFLDKVDIDDAIDAEQLMGGVAIPPCWCWLTSLGERWESESGLDMNGIWEAVLTHGNETLCDAEHLDDSRCIAMFVLILRSNLHSRHINSILAFQELVDLVENHIVDIKPLIEGIIGDDGSES